MNLGKSDEELNDTTTNIYYIKKEVERFIKERAWEKYHSPKNIAESIVIEACELLEHFQWLTINESWEYSIKHKKKIAEELADVFIYLLSLANVLNIDISSEVISKLEKNREKYPIDKYYGKYYKE